MATIWRYINYFDRLRMTRRVSGEYVEKGKRGDNKKDNFF